MSGLLSPDGRRKNYEENWSVVLSKTAELRQLRAHRHITVQRRKLRSCVAVEVFVEVTGPILFQSALPERISFSAQAMRRFGSGCWEYLQHRSSKRSDNPVVVLPDDHPGLGSEGTDLGAV